MRTRQDRIAQKYSDILVQMGRFAVNVTRDNAWGDEEAKENVREAMLIMGSLMSLMEKPVLAEAEPITQVKYVSTIPAPFAEEEDTGRTSATMRAGRDVA